MDTLKILGFEIVQTIYETNNTQICRVRNRDGKILLTKSLKVEQPTTKQQEHMEYEYKLLNEEHIGGELKALELIKHYKGHVIIMEDIDGIVLSKSSMFETILGNQAVLSMRDLQRILEVFIKMVGCLQRIHTHGLVHNSVHPKNFMIIEESGQVVLLDYSKVSTQGLYAEEITDNNTKVRELAYISPEQTGRMNKVLDTQSDFYSLGITLFELLCGRHPFESDNATQMIYSHLAKQPPNAKKINPNVPEILSHMIYKLMAKMPEDRYLKADGILFDLNRCLENLNEGGEIPEFELGTGDYSGQFEIPQKLYGRENEMDRLLAEYQKIKNGGKALITIAGHSGIGKTSLVDQLHKPIATGNGIYIKGKFDQYHRNVPCYAILKAVDQFCDFVLSESEEKSQVWKIRLADALRQDGNMLVSSVSRLKLIAGDLHNLTAMSPLEENTRFKAALQDMLSIIASPEQPLVMLIDDIHLTDMGSLEVIEEIMSNDKINGLLIVACYRDNEVDEGHPLVLSINKMATRQVDIQRIVLAGLDRLSAKQMLADALGCDPGSAAEISDCIYSKTGGNPFYMKQFLKHCCSKEYIFYDNANRVWDYSIEAIQNCPAEENVVDFLIRTINQIPADTTHLLSLGACIGQTFEVTTLLALTDKKNEQVLHDLREAVLREIVQPVKPEYEASGETAFRFSHDRFQQSFYTVMPETERNRTHYVLALHYEQTGFVTGDSIENQFIIADNYSKAFSILDTETEKMKVSDMLLRATRFAGHHSAYDTALCYLEQIIGSLEELHANEEFVFSVYVEYHSALCSLARYVDADEAYTLLEKIVVEPIDLTDSCCLQAVSLSNRGRYKDAFMLGLHLLEKLGVHFPAGDLLQILMEEIDVFYGELRHDTFPGIEALPKAESKLEISIGKILNRICTAGLFYDPLYLFWAIITSAKRVLANGYTPDGLSLFGSLTLLLIPFRNDYKLSYELAHSAMKLAEKNGYRIYRMYHLYSLINCHWFEGLKNSMPYARESCRGNISVGDFEFACFTYFTTQQVVLETCENIDELMTESDAALAFSEKHGNTHAYGSFIVFRQFCKSLINKGMEEGCFNDDHFSETEHNQAIGTNRMAQCFFYTLRALSATIYLDFGRAFELTEKAAPLMPTITGFYLTALHRFIHSLAICKKIEREACTEEETASLMSKLSANQKWLGERAADAPASFQHLYDLVEAERYVLKNKNNDSLTVYKEILSLYEKAMAGAAENNQIYHYALACELVGTQFIKNDALRSAAVYLKEAYMAYSSWGATAKVQQMTEKYNELDYLMFNNLKFRKEHVAVSEARPYINAGAHTGIFSTISTAIDFDSIIKASQAISSETKLDAILEKLIIVLLENSGAQDIYYLKSKGNSYCVQAEGHSEGETVLILPDRPVETGDFPLKILKYAERTHENIILDNAVISDLYGNDPYILSHRCKSVMCMPVINKGVLKGMLYLENNLIEGVFDKRRIQALEIIAAQLAISLENVRLFNDLLSKTEQVYKAEEDVLRSDIAFLQAQIKPHFLYNAINTISAFSLDDSQMARELLASLSHYLRGSFDFKNRDKLVTLRKELELVEAYLFIEKARFGERLQIRYHIDPDVDCLLPPLVIQPLVENAVIHGISERKKGGTIEITVRDEHNQVWICVADDGIGIDEKLLPKFLYENNENIGGVALKNIQRRLMQMYDHGLEIENKPTGGTRVVIRITK